ncbi:Cation transporting ATPase%2C C-terminus [Bordetella ansorpii]|uniref:Cation transporting ATPase, C-terminus n=1 Tax=Bordetella ansorpii TaxID=288768 RepID=A0A157SJR0_9BORD|nr:cation transporting ATPase C-terminal domain-containing protein [Bordetella ansorpii]SAI70501.1 Cation transporting ATPase%2C C-terminus [Bordetella ansorpii]
MRALTGNPVLWRGILSMMVLQLLFTYAPPLQVMFDTTGLPIGVWMKLLAGAVALLLVVEAEKLAVRSVPAWRCAAPPRTKNGSPQRARV